MMGGVNRLGAATSPYLLQHKDNPVDWWEWAPEAFEEARRREVPVLLSVGYSACHWCHVMAHESFEDDATAALPQRALRQRQGRPRGAARRRRRLYAGDHGDDRPRRLADDVRARPRRQPVLRRHLLPGPARRGQPAFRQVLEALDRGLGNRSDDVRRVAADLREHLRRERRRRPAVRSTAVLDAAVARLARTSTARAAASAAPRSSRPRWCSELLRHAHRTGSPLRGRCSTRTCEAMARGGIYDQLGGGFARYSRGPRLGGAALREDALRQRPAARRLRAGGARPLGERVAGETADFLVRELGTAEGGFASALDADSEGEEGRFYVWTPEQLDDGSAPTTAPGRPRRSR